MRFSTVTVAGLVASASAHMLMNTPIPYGKSTLNNSPLLPNGSDFPCKLRGAATFAKEGANNIMPLGSTQPLSFTGSAVHGGGSCQISIAYTETPDKNTQWKVIHSIEGGCPMRNIAGNNGANANAVSPDTYQFTIPTDLPTGTATLAWTWFNKIGNREMYMNCAPIQLTAGSAKRSDNATMLIERDQAAFDALPDMFVANIGNGCGTVDSKDVVFPQPGDSVEQNGVETSAQSTPTGAGCQAQKAGAAPTQGSGGSAPSSATPVVTAAPLAPAAPSQGGIFITKPAPSAPAATSAPIPVASSAPVVSVAPIAPAAPVASTPSTPSTPSTAGAQTGPCTNEGDWNCIGGTSFQRCASGQWSVVQQMAAGTTCTAGISTSINMVAIPAKREIRFSNAHVRHRQEVPV